MRIIVLLAILLLSLQGSAQNAAADNLLILELLQNQRYDEASETLKKMYPEPISDKKILSRIGYSLRMAGNDMKTESTLYFIAMSYKALKNYNKSVDYLHKTIKESISPNTAGYYAQIGDVLEKNQLVRKSLEAYQKSLFFDNKPLTLYTIATIYDQKIKLAKAALSYYKRYVNSKPPAEQKAYVEYANYRISQLSR